jgi:exonuclease III
MSKVKLLLGKTNTAVLALLETWLSDTVGNGEIAIDGYKIIRKDRDRHGGGVALYIREGLAYNIRPDLSEGTFEAVWVKIMLPKTKSFLICMCYRPPRDSAFLSHFENVLSKINPGTDLYILGHMNICLKQGKSCLFKKYSEIMSHFGLSQVIKEATRVGESCLSLLDHI